MSNGSLYFESYRTSPEVGSEIGALLSYFPGLRVKLMRKLVEDGHLKKGVYLQVLVSEQLDDFDKTCAAIGWTYEKQEMPEVQNPNTGNFLHFFLVTVK